MSGCGMSEKPETTEDIIAEMNRVEVCADGEPCLRDYARRFEAACKRELDALNEQIADLRQQRDLWSKRAADLVEKCNEQYAKLKQVGNATKLREADHNWDAICEKCLEGEPPDGCRYYGEPNGCNSPMYGEYPKPFGENAAVLRSAIIEILLEMEDMAGLEVGRKYKFSPDAIVQQCRDALAAPARNCDRFATVDEARKAYEEYRRDYIMRASNKFDFPVEFESWLLAPATEKEGGNNADK